MLPKTECCIRALAQGVKAAQAGEFTLRAYLNKKMDLSQAESVADLISSNSEALIGKFIPSSFKDL
mgnify:CR=1 FL=1